MKEQAEIRSNKPEIETQFIRDENGKHYQLINVGFNRGRRVYGCFLHIDLKDDGKVWFTTSNNKYFKAKNITKIQSHI